MNNLVEQSLGYIDACEPVGISPRKDMTTMFSYPDRGPYGDNSYPGNCSGLMLKDLFGFFRPRKVMDPAEGSGTTGDVCSEMGIEYTGLDLKYGNFDLQKDDIPESADIIFFHPPYWNLYKYSKIWGNGDERDLSLVPDWGEFIERLNNCLNRCYQALRYSSSKTETGRLIVLVGDIKRKGALYSMQREMIIPGTYEYTCIKEQHNVSTNNKSYGGNFIPIMHEYVIITRRDDPYVMRLMVNRVKYIDVRDYPGLQTWRDVVQSALEKLGGVATLEEIYGEIEGHKKCKSNVNWQAKVRQTLQIGEKDFTNRKRGVWALSWGK